MPSYDVFSDRDSFSNRTDREAVFFRPYQFVYIGQPSLFVKQWPCMQLLVSLILELYLQTKSYRLCRLKTVKPNSNCFRFNFHSNNNYGNLEDF